MLLHRCIRMTLYYAVNHVLGRLSTAMRLNMICCLVKRYCSIDANLSANKRTKSLTTGQCRLRRCHPMHTCLITASPIDARPCFQSTGGCDYLRVAQSGTSSCIGLFSPAAIVTWVAASDQLEHMVYTRASVQIRSGLLVA